MLSLLFFLGGGRSPRSPDYRPPARSATTLPTYPTRTPRVCPVPRVEGGQVLWGVDPTTSKPCPNILVLCRSLYLYCVAQLAPIPDRPREQLDVALVLSKHAPVLLTVHSTGTPRERLEDVGAAPQLLSDALRPVKRRVANPPAFLRGGLGEVRTGPAHVA